ncbi:MAG: protein kinase [Acidobacteria bacterium]|nr:protein kinase [Acidobacteriota bacterium]
MLCPYCGTASYNKRYCRQCGAALLKNQLSANTVAEIYSNGTGSESESLNLHASSATVANFNLTELSIGKNPEPASLLGMTLDKKYYLESELGVGGMGTVYRARRLLIGDKVAVKVLHPDQMSDYQAIERFRREAQTAARLKHANLVNIFDFGVSNEGILYQAMELAEGETLRQMIEREGTISEALSAEIIRQVCAGLDEAHHGGVVHRDIKPENILILKTTNGILVKVLDFGIVALSDNTVDKLTRTGTVLGTPHYMSPEQCMGSELDGRSDIYSLGVVLFEMLTGDVPFKSPTPSAIVIQQVNQAPPQLRSVNPNISSAVEAVVLHALAKTPDARPQSAGEMANELISATGGNPGFFKTAGYSGGTTLQQSKPTLESPNAVPGSRKPAVLLITLTLLLASAIGGAYWWYRPPTQPSANTNNATLQNHLQASTVNAIPGIATSKAEGSAIQALKNLWEVITDQTSKTTDAANALDGVIDNQVAVIEPGGQLALNYRNGHYFGDGGGPDVHILGPQQESVSYLVFVRNDPAENWRRIDINRKSFNGMTCHDMGHHGVRQARQVMIRNIGTTTLSIDATKVSYKDKVVANNPTKNNHVHKPTVKPAPPKTKKGKAQSAKSDDRERDEEDEVSSYERPRYQRRLNRRSLWREVDRLRRN